MRVNISLLFFLLFFFYFIINFFFFKKKRNREAYRKLIKSQKIVYSFNEYYFWDKNYYMIKFQLSYRNKTFSTVIIVNNIKKKFFFNIN